MRLIRSIGFADPDPRILKGPKSGKLKQEAIKEVNLKAFLGAKYGVPERLVDLVDGPRAETG